MTTWTEGETVGRYTLQRKLGTGSFAEVWLAKDSGQLGFTRKVAVKLLRRDATDPAAVATFLAEARLAANLHHPNTVDILRVDQVGDLVVVAMDYVDWGSLKDLIDKVALAGLSIPRSVVLDLGLDIVKGLHHGHTATGADDKPICIIHRDVKPANVLLGSSGTARLADFGMAKAMGDATATATGTLKGTPAYVAPEIWKGGRDFHPTVDLFAAGCILHELITLERLFQGDSMASIFGQVALRTAVEDATAAHERFPALGPVVERLLARDPQQRYRDGADVIADLLQVRRSLVHDADVSVFLKLIDTAGSGQPSQGVRVPASVTDASWAEAFASATGESVPVQQVPAPAPQPAAPTTTPTGTQSLLIPSPDEPNTRRSRRAATLAILAVAAVLAVATIVVFMEGQEPASDELEVASLIAPAPGSSAVVAALDEPAAASADEDESQMELPDLAALPAPIADDPPLTASPTSSMPASTYSGKPAPAKPIDAPTPVVPEPVRAVAPARKPAAVLPPAATCVEFTSQPPGARLWIDGVTQSSRALAGGGRGTEREPGRFEVGMGMGAKPSATLQVSLGAGQALRVHCELLMSHACSTSALPAGSCQ